MKTLSEIIDWFKLLKQQGITKSEVLDVLEFDSDEYPNIELLKKAKEIVFSEVKQ